MNWETFGVIFGTVATLCGGVTFLMNKFYQIGKIHSDFDKLKDDFKELKDMVAGLSAEMKVTNASLQDTKDDVLVIKTLLLSKGKDAEAALTQRHSPRTLNDLGLEILRLMDGRKFLEENKEALFARIDLRKPKTALDLEQLAIFVCAEQANEDYFIPIKKFVYNCPAVTIGENKPFDVTLDSACYVLAFPLRDMYLDEHPELR